MVAVGFVVAFVIVKVLAASGKVATKWNLAELAWALAGCAVLALWWPW